MASLVLRVTKGSSLHVVDRLKTAIDAYCPVETCYRFHRRDPTKTRRLIETPLFPGYAFAVDTEQARKLDIKKTLGPTMDAHFMSFKDKYLLVSDRDMDRVKTIEGSIRDLAQLSKTGKIWKAGDSVTVLRGVLTGALGTILDMKRRTALVALRGKSSIFMDISLLG